jgi:hypothetical protein
MMAWTMPTGHLKRLFSLAVFLGAWMIAEGAARLVFSQPIREFVPSANPRLIYESNPAYPGINSLGMRQGEVDRSGLSNRFVIAVIGDSHAYGAFSVHPANSFPARLEYHLNANANAKVTVLNFGVPGYNMVQELEVLEAKALSFHPNLIVLQYCINDDHISNFIQPRYATLNRAIHRSVLLTTAWSTMLYSELGRSRVLPYVEHVPDLLLFAPGLVGTPTSRETGTAHGFTHPTRDKDLVPARYHAFIGRENLERAVETFGEICQRAGIPTLATGFIEEHDEALYERSGFSVYSFFTMFEGQDMRRYGYDPERTDGHFFDRGNDFIGRTLGAYISGRFSLQPAR